MIKKRFEQKWKFYSPDAVLTSSILKSKGKTYIAFGGHDKRLYLMDKEQNLLDAVVFDGWCRCSYPIDLDGDSDDELIVGAGDGNFLVLKLDPVKEIFITIMNYVSQGKVLCCTAGDITRDGSIELIFGGEDKTLKILNYHPQKMKDIEGIKPLYIFYYDSWVTSCAIGVFRHSEFSKPICGVVVGTKSGVLELIIVNENGPDILWRENLGSQLNAIAIGDVTNDGNNDIIVATDDSYIKVFNSEGYRLRYVKVEGGRPVSFLVEDIDGDGACEIIVGCADGTLRVYHNEEVDSVNLVLKWKTKVSTSIKTITYLADDTEELRDIIFGGYERALRNVTDQDYGKKEKINKPPTVHLPKLDIPRVETDAVETIVVPENLREYIIKLLSQHQYLASLDIIIKELQKIGYTTQAIEQELQDMQKEQLLISERKEISIWYLSEGLEVEEVKEEQTEVKEEMPKKRLIEAKIPPKPEEEGVKAEVEIELPPEGMPTEIKSEEERKVVTISTESELDKKIIEFIREKELVSTKTELVEAMVSLGFKEEEIETEVEVLKNNNKIKYSRTAPRGWSLFEE